jgi:hypothetical protein
LISVDGLLAKMLVSVRIEPWAAPAAAISPNTPSTRTEFALNKLLIDAS